MTDSGNCVLNWEKSKETKKKANDICTSFLGLKHVAGETHPPQQKEAHQGWIHTERTPFAEHLPSLKLTVTWKWMVGIRSFPFGALRICRATLVWGRAYTSHQHNHNNAWAFCGTSMTRIDPFKHRLPNNGNIIPMHIRTHGWPHKRALCPLKTIPVTAYRTTF